MLKLIKLLKDPYYTIGRFMTKYCPWCMSDKFFLKVRWLKVVGYKLDLRHPKTFNEKLQWLKLYDRKPVYTTMVDKYLVKQWVADKVGNQYINPTLAVYKSVEEIDLNKLPDQFVLKCNHDSGSIVFCYDKQSFDFADAKRKLNQSLHNNFYSGVREWPYKNVKPLIIAEQLLIDSESDDIIDYKMMVFNGKVKCCVVCTNRRGVGGVHVTFYDTDWKKMPVVLKNHPSDSEVINKPGSFDKMVEIAEILSENIPFLRVDFYEINDKPYFGEITFYPFAGFGLFNPAEWDLIFGNMIELPKL